MESEPDIKQIVESVLEKVEMSDSRAAKLDLDDFLMYVSRR